MILHDLFDWSNSGVGLAGLALTVGALWQATGAKRAVTEARKPYIDGMRRTPLQRFCVSLNNLLRG
jgi:hypothetical protein